MDRLRAFIQQNRRIVLIVAIGVAIILGFWVGTRLLGGGPSAVAPTTPPAATPAPATPPSATPAPAPAHPPAGGQPAPTPAPSGVVPSTPTGRPDPFVPVISEATAAPGGPSPGAAPPSTPLPPPPFPVPPPSASPAPGAPGAPGAAPPPPPSAGVQVLGIISDAKSVVIVSVGGKTDILFEGESSGDLKVIKIDAVRGIVTFERNGKRFDLKIGGG